MPRVKLRDQDAYHFHARLPLADADINDAGHLSFDRVLSLARRAWQTLFTELGVRDTDLGDGATGIVVSDVTVNYRGEAFAGEVVAAEICPFEVEEAGFRLAMRFTVPEGPRLVALLELGIVAFCYDTHQKASLPEPVAARLRELEA